MRNESRIGTETREQEAADPVAPPEPPIIRAKRVAFEELVNPGLLAVHGHDRPFTREEIALLTEGMEEFALVADADWLYLEGSSQSSQKE